MGWRDRAVPVGPVAATGTTEKKSSWRDRAVPVSAADAPVPLARPGQEADYLARAAARREEEGVGLGEGSSSLGPFPDPTPAAPPEDFATWVVNRADAKRPGLKLPHPDVQSPKYTPGAPKTSAWDAAVRHGLSGLTAGHGEDLQGVIGGFFGKDESSREDYKKAARNADAVTAHDHPVVSGLADLAGTALLTAATAGGGAAGPALLGRLGLLGVAEGSGRSDKDIGSDEWAGAAADGGAQAALAGRVGQAAPKTMAVVGAGLGAYGAMDEDLTGKERVMSGVGGALAATGGLVKAGSEFRNAKADKAAAAAKDALTSAKEPLVAKQRRLEHELQRNEVDSQHAKVDKIDAAERNAQSALKVKIAEANKRLQQLKKEDPELASFDEGARSKQFRERATTMGKERLDAERATSKQTEKVRALEKQLADLQEEASGLDASMSGKRAAEFQAQSNRLQAREGWAKEFPDLAEQHPLPEATASVKRKLGESYLRNTPDHVGDPDEIVAAERARRANAIDARRAIVERELEAARNAPAPEAEAAVRVNPMRKLSREEIAALADELDLAIPEGADPYSPTARFGLSPKAQAKRVERIKALAEKAGLEHDPDEPFDPDGPFTRLRPSGAPTPKVKSSLDDVPDTNPGDQTSPGITDRKRRTTAVPSTKAEEAPVEDPMVGKTFAPVQSKRERELGVRRMDLKNRLADVEADSSDEAILSKGERQLRQDEAISPRKMPTSLVEAAAAPVQWVGDRVLRGGVRTPSKGALGKNHAQAAYFTRVAEKMRTNKALAHHVPALEAAAVSNNPEFQALILELLSQDPDAARVANETE